MAPDPPFRPQEPSAEELAKAYYGKHGLRETYTREQTERRRISSHTLRRFLTAAQDKLLTAKFTKIRDEYRVESNSDAVLAFAQQLIAEGKEKELSPELVKLAKATVIPKRGRPFDDARDH
ncbi:MAG TPA: hypothetical protein VI796_07095 [Candidatus Thermoplasmatota archaeon]|nr:hypothetical protein [Candidatus Thermoplasmatota archaeon]